MKTKTTQKLPQSKDLYQRTFNGISNKIPLIVKVNNPNHVNSTCIECMNSPEKVLEDYHTSHLYTNQVKSDYTPFVESNFLENLIPSFFGAETHTSPGGHVDVKPPFTSVLDLGDLSHYTLGGPLLEQAKAHLIYLRDHADLDCYVSPTRFMSPLDYAVILCGGNFYMELLLYPEESMAFMNRIVDLTIETFKIMKDILDEPYNECITIRGAYFQGIRLTGDAIVNLSPEQIATYLIPLFNRFKEVADNLMLHYCCTPAPSGHVVKALCNSDAVLAVDNWQGYETFFTNNEDALTQDQIAICTDLSVDELDDLDALFTRPFFSDVPRNGGRGLVVAVNASSVSEGNELYSKWTNYFNQKSS